MIPRTIARQIQAKLGKPKVTLLYGPRQSGKTTLIHALLRDRMDSVLFLNGDDSDIRETLSGYSSTKLKALIGAKSVVCIDEAQRIPEIGVILKILVDTFPEVMVIATGSSSFELQSNVNEPLTGRKYEFLLYPLSFQEMVAHHGFLEETRMLEHRLLYGYYPEIVSSPGEEKELLGLLANSYLYKDLLALEKIHKSSLLEKIVRALALQVGSEVSFNEIAQLVGATQPTIEKYIHLLEQAFVLFQLPAFSRNVRNEIKKGRKIYFYDNGIRNAIINNFTPLHSRVDTGALWENFLISERVKKNRYTHSSAKGYFWRTTQQQEIDYLEEIDGVLHTFEFKFGNKKRSKLPLTFSNNYEPHTFLLVNQENLFEFLHYD